SKVIHESSSGGHSKDNVDGSGASGPFPVGSETHFKVVIISDSFKAAKTPIARHRLVNEILRDEVASDGPVHALSIVAMTPDKWEDKINKGGVIGPSPNCRGGDGSLPSKNGRS
ncbi:hypothetical protein THAOC_19512, partial [Thalassiosira oceanica]